MRTERDSKRDGERERELDIRPDEDKGYRREGECYVKPKT